MQVAHLGQEPRVDRREQVGVAVAVAHGLLEHQHALRVGHAQLVLELLLGQPLPRPRQGPPVEARLERAQRLLERLLEGAAHRHGLAHGLHLRGQLGLGARELLEGEARDLGDHVVDRGLEGGRGLAGDVVLDLVEREADGELGCDLGDREAGGLGRELFWSWKFFFEVFFAFFMR